MRVFQDLREAYNPSTEFAIFNKNTRAVLGRAGGLVQAKAKALNTRKQCGLKFDDVSLMTRRMLYETTSAAPSRGEEN